MARNGGLDASDKVRLLRDFAFHIQRKRAADEVLRTYLDEQFELGRRKEYRAASDALDQDGFAAALKVLEMVGDEAAILLDALVSAKDHRALAHGLSGLADLLESQGGKGR